MTEYNSQVEFQMKIVTDTHKQNVKSLEERVTELETQKAQLVDRNKSLEKQKFSVISENEHKYGDVLKNHERELEALRAQHKSEILDIQAKNQE